MIIPFPSAFRIPVSAPSQKILSKITSDNVKKKVKAFVLFFLRFILQLFLKDSCLVRENWVMSGCGLTLLLRCRYNTMRVAGIHPSA